MRKVTAITIAARSLRFTLGLVLALPLLAGCVTYYYPAVEQADGVYYAADDPAYPGNAAVDYVSVGYYPWWSVDYFYLGYGFGHSNISFGFSYGYPGHPAYGWAYYPYPAWYYDPWYYAYWYAPVHHHYPWHGHHAYWNVHYRHYRDHHRGHGSGHGSRHGDHRYADSGRHREHRQAEPSVADFNARRDRPPARDERGSFGSGEEVRNVTVAPGNRSQDRGMIVGSRDGGKWTRPRLEPVSATSLPTNRAAGPRYSAEPQAPEYRTVQRGNATVRSPAESKRGEARTAPISGSGYPLQVTGQSRSGDWGSSGGPSRVTQPAPGMTVRAPAASKPSGPRTQPVGAPRQVASQGRPGSSAGSVSRSSSSRSSAPKRTAKPAKPSRSSSKSPPRRKKADH